MVHSELLLMLKSQGAAPPDLFLMLSHLGAVMMPDLRYIKIPNRFNAALPVSIKPEKNNKRHWQFNIAHTQSEEWLVLSEIALQYT